nr:VOC family protein [Kineococcus aurantiacus]
MARDPGALAAFYAPLVGMSPARSSARVAALRGDGGPFLEFVASPTPHTVKNRVHLDVRPTRSGAGRRQVLARAVEAGARYAPPVPGASWSTLLDPEGNEFCVLAEPR